MNANSAVITPAGCETSGTVRYTAVFENTAFETQTEDVTIDPIGHDWGEPTYVWSDDNLTCTATRVCNNDETHVETETVEASYEVITPATTEAPGLGRYTAEFENDLFTTQTKDVPIPQLVVEGYHIIVTDYTKGKATTSIDAEQLYSGDVSFTVAAELVATIGIVNADGTITRLACTTVDDVHTFTVTVTDADVNLVLVMRGDYNLDSNVQNRDATLMRQYLAGTSTTVPTAVQIFAVDLNEDGKLQNREATMINQAVAGTNHYNW